MGITPQHIHKNYSLGTPTWIGNEEPDVDAENRQNDAKQCKNGEFADETYSDQNPDEHDGKQTRPVDAVVIESFPRHWHRCKYLGLWHHVLLKKRQRCNYKLFIDDII